MKRIFLSQYEELTQESYSKMASEWAGEHNVPGFWLNEFVHFFSLMAPCGIVLDTGCGAGRDEILFRTHGFRYIGIDLSRSMLNEAVRVTRGAIFVQGDMYLLPFPSKTFDGFWASDSLLHIPKRNTQYILESLRSVTKIDGIGFVSVQEGPSCEKMILGKNKDDYRFFAFYRQGELESQFAAAGLEILDQRKKTNGKTSWLTYFVKRTS